MKLALIPLLATLVAAAPSAPGWRFDLKAETSGIVALEAIVVSPTLVLFFDRASNDPLQINNHSAWGALWNLESSTVQPLDVFSNSFCGSGALISNGSMVCMLHCDRPRSGTLTSDACRSASAETRMASPETRPFTRATKLSASLSRASPPPARAAHSSTTRTPFTFWSSGGTRLPFVSSTVACSSSAASTSRRRSTTPTPRSATSSSRARKILRGRPSS